MENIVIRKYREDDLAAMAEIWNEVVEDGIAFPQTEKLDIDGARASFAAQTYSGAAEVDGKVVGLYG